MRMDCSIAPPPVPTSHRILHRIHSRITRSNSWDLKLNFELSAGIAIDEAVVTGEAFNRIEDQVQMSKMEIPMDQVRRLPAIGGEVDLLKSLSSCRGYNRAARARLACMCAVAVPTKTSSSSTVYRCTA